LKETVNGFPTTGCAGIATGLATTGLAPPFRLLLKATGTSVNEMANTTPTRPPDTRFRLVARLPARLEGLERIEHLLEGMQVIRTPPASTAALIAH
jgi:hypothetical protein